MIMRNSLSFLASAATLAFISLYSSNADAGRLDACGDIFVEAGANCEVLVEGGCLAECEPVAFTASCAAEGSISCQGECNIDADVECTASCQGSCEAECEVDPGTFDCKASCEGNCSADCSAACASDSNSAECQASCKATCGAECDASCTIEPGQADCMAQCQGCCGGECRAQVNMDCQIGCQSDLYVECKADLQGGCEVQCEKPEGAIFCDGQFVDVGNVQSCANALRDLLDIEVEFQAEASASLSCAVTDDPARGGAALMGFGLLCLAGLGRRRRV
ncbi:hypothetical protein ENSA7_78090 [Enhygromyxa salina]|uniref:Keratin associated protein n=2 Tax=Enhygromyxa salina TaxID=215803 RepID=A0A2S9XN43_9BACT|nr:hypothetical protein ENSA7_78090 [Enhygromyxa salina]